MGILKKVGKFGGLGLVGALAGGKKGGVLGKIASVGGFGLAGLALSGKDKKKPTPVEGSPVAALDDAGDDAEYTSAWDRLAKADGRAAVVAAKAAAPVTDGSTAETEAKRIQKIRARRLAGS